MLCPILILAAGKSSRMRGGDKLLEMVDGVPQLRRLTLAALSLGQPVFVALPDVTGPRAAILSDLAITPLVLSGSAEGMGGTLRDGVMSLPPSDIFMVLLGDLVAISASDIAGLFAQAMSDPAPIWRGATDDGRAGHPIIFNDTVRPSFANLSGDSGGEEIVRAFAPKTKLFPLAENRARLDLDTPEDWADYRAGRLS